MCQIVTIKIAKKEIYRFGTFWSHTQIDKKSISRVIMTKIVPIWYNYKRRTNL